jgi:hypothetical protein
MKQISKEKAFIMNNMLRELNIAQKS